MQFTCQPKKNFQETSTAFFFHIITLLLHAGKLRMQATVLVAVCLFQTCTNHHPDYVKLVSEYATNLLILLQTSGVPV